MLAFVCVCVCVCARVHVRVSAVLGDIILFVLTVSAAPQNHNPASTQDYIYVLYHNE